MKLGVSLPVREMKDDLGAIRAYAELAEELGLTHLRVPDMVIRPNGGHLHEPMMLLAWVAAFTERIQLCPSVIVLPARQTAHFAKQVAELDVLSRGRVRLGIGVGASPEQYEALGQDFHSRGARCDEQLPLLQALLSQETVTFEGRWDRIDGMGIEPLPVQPHIPIWYGGAPVPGDRVVRRIGRFADGWFVLCSPEEYPQVKSRIDAAASAAGRDPGAIQTEAGVAVVGPREAQWQQRVSNWRETGLDYVCLRTLGGDLTAQQHLDCLARVVPEAAGLVG
jgi:probable F420-dependent oxidoreductase